MIMTKKINKIFIFFIILSLILPVASLGDDEETGPAYIPGDIFVVLKPEENNAVITADDLRMGSEAFRVASFAASSGSWVKETYANLSEAGNSIFALLHSDSISTDQLLSEISSRPEVIAASPNYIVHNAEVFTNDAITPSNDGNNYLWGLRNIQAPEAWEYSTGSPDIYVAVIDTGIDYTNPDLTDNVIRGFGTNIIANSDDARDDHGHGTHVAGTIGAVGNNNIGTVGVNWDVGLIPIKALDSTGSGSLNQIARGFDHIAELLDRNPGLKIAAINCSIEVYLNIIPNHDNLVHFPLWRAFKALDEKNKSVIVVAAGNQEAVIGAPTTKAKYSSGSLIYRKGWYEYPASFLGLNNMISVSALDTDNTIAYFSNTSADISAPGVNITSTWRQNASEGNSIFSTSDGTMMKLESGTSMAAPHVSGAVALLASLKPEQSAYQLKTAILRGNTNGALDIVRAIDFQNENLNLPVSAGTNEYDDYNDYNGNSGYNYTGNEEQPGILDIIAGAGGNGCNSGFGILFIMLTLIILPKKVRTDKILK